MNTLSTQAHALRELIEESAFLVSSKAPAREIHSKLVRCLAILEPLCEATSASGDHYEEEVRKVARRLNLWAKRQSQINSRILIAWLRLRRTGQQRITESDLRQALDGESSFPTNFAQMKIIADRNHGKVFEQHGEVVTIWPPVTTHVETFEQQVFAEGS